MNYLRIFLRAVPSLVTGLALCQTGGTHPVGIFDPVLQMKAWTLTNVPAGWTAEGTMLPGSSCSNATSPVYRVASPDGQAGVFFLPRVDWAWGAHMQPSNDCLPLHQAISAREYLNRLVQLREMTVVREEEVPGLEEARRNTETMNRQMPGMNRTVDIARFLVRYSVNDQPKEEWLDATVSCSGQMVPGVGRQAGCSAFATRQFAPAGKLQEMAPVFKAMQMVLNQPWMNAWTAAMVNKSNALTQQQTQALLEQGRLAEAGRMRQHQDFMSNMQSQGAARKERFQHGQYEKQRNKEDYVDYILDCQRLSSGNARVSVGSNCPSRQTGW